MVLFINGLPLALVELKNAADENATIWTAFEQLQTYRAELPTLFALNALLVISGLHLKHIYAEGELSEGATAEESSVVQTEGWRKVRGQGKPLQPRRHPPRWLPRRASDD